MDFAFPVVVIRPALPADKPDVLEFCKGIWGGEDYIPLVWDTWMNDPAVGMYVAEYAGHAVGLACLTHLAPGQWWLEGLRVDPAHQGKKIASRLHERLVDDWLAHGDGVIRLWTGAERVKVHHLCQRLGFHKTQERSIYTAVPLDDESPAPFTPLTSDEDIPAAAAYLRTCPGLALAGGLIDLGWRMAEPNEATLRALLHWQHGRILWWRKREGLLCLWEDEDERGRYPMLALPTCAPAQLPDLLRDTRRYTAQIGAHKVSWNIALLPELLDALEAAGFTRAWDGCNFQFERSHPQRP